ncbi:hypothetical protein HMPREF9540_02527 [Escherichia coli MS 115-1]|nr:hypothetical protein HMPREF9540_02527 [Escherichia coli MS 115-1]
MYCEKEKGVRPDTGSVCKAGFNDNTGKYAWTYAWRSLMRG